jgi:hypothetical protein
MRRDSAAIDRDRLLTAVVSPCDGVESEEHV